ncbi:MAG: peptide chain release factor N(5)-glutamine methyltransferase [Elusimicrobiota bacterium]
MNLKTTNSREDIPEAGMVSSIRDALDWADKCLSGAGINTPRRDAEVLLSHVTGIETIFLYLDALKEIDGGRMAVYKDMIEQRSQRIPLDYIRGYADFMGMKIEVGRDTLVPRPETELLVEKALEILSVKQCADVLDIGTGSGNIALALAKMSGCRVLAIEKSAAAAGIAEKNAVRNGLQDKIVIAIVSMEDYFANTHTQKFDMIVSNPPYVKETEYSELEKEVKEEPREALVAGIDGLIYIRMILENSMGLLKPGGSVFIEIGYGQKDEVEQIAVKAGYTKRSFIKDYSGIYRILSVSI